jgi:hypothetical protein
MTAISEKYSELGGPAGFLGPPIGPEALTSDGKGAFQHFQFGSIYWTQETGAHEVHGAIHGKWAELGWENFGYPSTDESGTPDGKGRFNHFHNLKFNADSSIYYTQQTGAHEVHGAIRDKWAALGWENFGYPSTDESGTPDGKGRFNHFHNLKFNADSSIYYTQETGAHEVHGLIRDKWAALGWENFGYPSTDETGTPDGVGRFNHFHNLNFNADSSIYYTQQTGAHEVHGAIRDTWISLGSETGLGYPTTDQFLTPDLSWESNHFERGSILWSRTGWPTAQGAQVHHAGRPTSLTGALPLFSPSPLWGFIANPGFEGRSVKSAYFFAGNWKFGKAWYEYPVRANDGFYTLHPSDARHLGWSESQANRDFALGAMLAAGLNVIKLSYWGQPGTDRWAYWAPMQSSTQAHNQVFDTALAHNLLISPCIESAAATNFDPDTKQPIPIGNPPTHLGNSPAYIFADDFPGSADNPAPGLIVQIEDLIDRYLKRPSNPQWPSRWLQLFDSSGKKRYVISIIQARSNQPGVKDQAFAQGLDLVADAISKSRQVDIGFVLDPLPGDGYSPTPSAKGFLAATRSFLAIESFISEIAFGTDDLRNLLGFKYLLVDNWVQSGVPFILDISPGYDAHIIFPPKPPNIDTYFRIGNNEIWHNGQTQMITATAGANSIRGITFNTWNGYTEGYAAVPTLERGDQAFTWLQSLLQLVP